MPKLKTDLPTISIIIPTLNAAGPLGECLRRIRNQDYPKSKYEIIIADGGSVDKTIEIAKKYKCRVVPNKLKTGEAGKAAGLKAAKNEIICLVDSDNYLPDKNWLRRMVEPFSDTEIIGSEPIEYTYRKKDGYITRYCALIGMNDPICMYLGNYDRYNYLTGRWTDLPVKEKDCGNYLKLTLEKYKVPTIGANGTMIRRKLIEKQVGDYLFDIDEIHELISKGKNKFAKVKVGIIHVFSGTVSTFIRKQKRRIKDFGYYNKIGARKYPWNKLNKAGFVKFVIFSALWLPTFIEASIGYIKKPDRAWFFHPLACWLTLWVYGWGKIGQMVFGARELNRANWKQS
jgi:glycosyltransferase involved in cell wall biosynthesis